jgi:hypothetical protein
MDNRTYIHWPPTPPTNATMLINTI